MRRVSRVAVIMVATTLVTLLVQRAVGRPAGAPPPTAATGGAVTAVKMVRQAGANGTSSTSFMPLPGASTNVTVPAGTKAYILARFTGESHCDVTLYCLVLITINGVEGQPASGSDLRFDTGGGQYRSLSVERSRGKFNPGTYPVQVFFAISGTGSFVVDDWHLTVERIKTS